MCVFQGLKQNKPRWPTFQEFVKYLIDSHKQGHPMDMHWTPITQFCTPCMVPFDVIAKMETLQVFYFNFVFLVFLKKNISGGSSVLNKKSSFGKFHKTRMEESWQRADNETTCGRLLFSVDERSNNAVISDLQVI